jgi:hypothetical protein
MAAIKHEATTLTPAHILIEVYRELTVGLNLLVKDLKTEAVYFMLLLKEIKAG